MRFMTQPQKEHAVVSNTFYLLGASPQGQHPFKGGELDSPLRREEHHRICGHSLGPPQPLCIIYYLVTCFSVDPLLVCRQPHTSLQGSDTGLGTKGELKKYLTITWISENLMTLTMGQSDLLWLLRMSSRNSDAGSRMDDLASKCHQHSPRKFLRLGQSISRFRAGCLYTLQNLNSNIHILKIQ